MKKMMFLLLLPAAVLAQPPQYAINWHKISGGGGASVNSAYSVTGTIGQAEAGETMTGGNYSVTGGFWGMISVVATAGAPALTITPSAAGVIVSWSAAATGWTLQQTADLSARAWTTSAFPISNDGATQSIIIPTPSGNSFFRLMR